VFQAPLLEMLAQQPDCPFMTQDSPIHNLILVYRALLDNRRRLSSRAIGKDENIALPPSNDRAAT